MIYSKPDSRILDFSPMGSMARRPFDPTPRLP